MIFGVKHYADALWEVVKKRNIAVNLRTNLVEVLPEKSLAVFENMDTGERSTTEVSLWSGCAEDINLANQSIFKFRSTRFYM